MSETHAAYDARRHEQKADGEVIRYGMARVQGRGCSIDETVCPDAPNGATGALIMQMCEDLKRNSVGASALDVYRLTQALYGADPELEPLLSTDVMQKRQVVRSAGEADHWDVPGVEGRAAARLHVANMPWRYGLPTPRARKGEHVTESALIAPSDRPGYVFIGHQLTPRAALKNRKGQAKRADRTVAVKTLDTLPAVFNAVSTLNRGERIVITYKGSRFTITRGKGKAGTYGVTPPAGKRADGIRTPETVARKVSELVA